ncbi:MAG: hypothetical protein HZB76_02185 [Chlamydiae bacterium]|nr:hypothetical protein [Chlamydiota bacterium]
MSVCCVQNNFFTSLKLKIQNLDSAQVEKIIKIVSIIASIAIGIFFSQAMSFDAIFSALAGLGSGLGILGAGKVTIAHYKKKTEAAMIGAFKETEKTVLAAFNSLKLDLTELDRKKKEFKNLITQTHAKGKKEMQGLLNQIQEATKHEIKDLKAFGNRIVSELQLDHLKSSFEHVESTINSLIQKGFKLDSNNLIDLKAIPRTITTMEELAKEKLHLEALQAQLNQARSAFEQTKKELHELGCVIIK